MKSPVEVYTESVLLRSKALKAKAALDEYAAIVGADDGDPRLHAMVKASMAVDTLMMVTHEHVAEAVANLKDTSPKSRFHNLPMEEIIIELGWSGDEIARMFAEFRKMNLQTPFRDFLADKAKEEMDKDLAELDAEDPAYEDDEDETSDPL